MWNVLLVGIGGFIGSVLRYLLSGLAHELSGRDDFPIGTLLVNVLGCFVIGVFSQLAETRSAFTPEIRALVAIGILGGFTTFSSFGNETLNLWRDREGLLAFFNIAFQLVLGLAAVATGRWCAFKIWG